ncbi:MAG TPA: CpsB/CapC family capsule biosynthesis tyrosine phosphatase [Clostridia bacterium]|nr:CpsB/CapC family capsule biosynthesis tyrosine phosphatase [Clostridia bacterium]
MIDIHAHILYGLDDGPENEDTTLRMLRSAKSEGIDRIIATPHFIYGANRYDMKLHKERQHEAAGLIKKNNVGVKLYAGNELFLDEFIPGCIRAKQCFTLAGSDYVLIELPVTGFPKHIDSILYRILGEGRIPVLAHAERYEQVQSDPEILYHFIQMGCFIQVNSASITGESGRRLQETSREIFSEGIGHLVATDMHSDQWRAPRLRDSYEVIKGWLGEERAFKIFETNPEAILKNVKIVPDEPVTIRKRHFLAFSR